MVNSTHRQRKRKTGAFTAGAFSPRVGGGGYSHKLPIRVCAAQRGRGFEAPDLERGIHFIGVFYNGV